MKVIESHTVPENIDAFRLQEYAHLVFKNLYSRSATKKAIKKELILIDNKIGDTGSWINPGQKLELLQKDNKVKVFSLKLEVILENDEFAIINKPSGFPTNGNYFKTIEHALPFNLSPSNSLNALEKPVPVHRLDTPTSGLLIIAKTLSSQQYFYKLWESNEIQKTYHAVVKGSLSENITISADIDEKESCTHVFPISSHNEYSLMKISPDTGRTHQIRKHLSGMGLPIVGDIQYGSNIKLSKEQGICLAATGLLFPLENSKEKCEVNIEIPKLFRKYI